eukprot:scaffold6565_cov76-Skeletonema_marinoi.AAC.2
MESLLAGEDKADESGEADEAAEALSGLKTADEEESHKYQHEIDHLFNPRNTIGYHFDINH